MRYQLVAILHKISKYRFRTSDELGMWTKQHDGATWEREACASSGALLQHLDQSPERQAMYLSRTARICDKLAKWTNTSNEDEWYN